MEQQHIDGRNQEKGNKMIKTIVRDELLTKKI